MTSGNSVYNLDCHTCHVRFHEIELQRDHYKSDWHRYNVKRKILNLPAVTAENFQERVEAQEAEKNAVEKNGVTHYCTVCKKSFGNEKALKSHLVSNKHLEAVKISSVENHESPEIVSSNAESDATNTKNSTDEKPKGKFFPPEPQIELIKKASASKMEVDNEDMDSEEWEEVDGEAIPINVCLFCEHESKDMDKNIRHMSVEHSFFIPDAEYCVDVEGLLQYLGEKVGEGMVCLWCNDRSRQFYTLQAAQQHMRDKGHCKVRHEGESVFEFTDFYDYSSSYPTGSDETNPDELYQPEPAMFNDKMQLVLPSGITLGHRALKVYYKQYVRPGSQLVQSKQTKRIKLLQQYKSIGYGEVPANLAQQKHRDQKYFKWARDKYRLKVGMQGNATLQTHFRRQIQF